MSSNLPIVRDNRVRDRLAAVGQTVFTFDAPLFDAADLRVFVKTPASEYFVQRTSGFDVTLLADSLGATVTFALPPLVAGGALPVVVRLQGARVHNRLLDVTRGGIVRSQLLEGELDRQTLVLQELRRDVDATEGAAQAATTAAITATAAGETAVQKAEIAVDAADRAEAAAATVEGAVSYAVEQDLTPEQKAQAQANLGLEGLQNALTPFGFTATAGQAAFDLGMSPLPSACIFSLNGAWLVGGGVDYAVAGSTLTLTTAAEAGDRISGVAIAPFTVANAMLSAANLADLANAAVARANLGLGSAAVLSAGTGANDVLKLDAAGKVVASVSVSGAVIGRAYAETADQTPKSVIIPLDNTIPQITEGTQILSVSYTPKLAGSKLRIRFSGGFSASTGSFMAAAIFLNNGNDAVAVGASVCYSAGYNSVIAVDAELTPSGAVPQTIAVRIGSSAGTMALAYAGGGYTPMYGGASKAVLIVEEIAP